MRWLIPLIVVVLCSCTGEILGDIPSDSTGAGGGTSAAGTGGGSTAAGGGVAGTGGGSPSTGGSGGSGGAGGAGGTGGGTVEPELPPFAAPVLSTRVLLSWQYKLAVADLLGDAAAATLTLPNDPKLNGLSAIGSSQLSLGIASVDLYETNALAAAKAAMAVPAQKAKLITCTAATPTDDACMNTVVKALGRRAFRRPLATDEVTRWVALGKTVATAYSAFDKGVEFVIVGLLQSPNFLYRVETGVVAGGTLKLTGYEMASRLSFFLTGSAPDDALMTAAQNGELDTPAGVKTWATKLVNGTRAQEAMYRFWSEMLELDALPNTPKDKQAFPNFDNVLAASMAEETRRVIADITFDRNDDVRRIFDTDSTFVDAKLATHYGVTGPASGFAKVLLPAGQPRAGILTQGSILTVQAHTVSTSPTYRGKFIRERLLCEAVQAPPPNVNTTLPEPPVGSGPLSLRQRLQQHQTDPGCASCHKLMDNMGFAYENFDAIGRYRTTDNTVPVDPTGKLDATPFTDARALAGLIANDPRVTKCMVRSIYRHASGHLEQSGEARPLKALDDSFAAGGYKLKNLLVDMVTSDAFLLASAPAGVTP